MDEEEIDFGIELGTLQLLKSQRKQIEDLKIELADRDGLLYVLKRCDTCMNYIAVAGEEFCDKQLSMHVPGCEGWECK